MEKSNYVNLNPMGIENDSMAIIERELGPIVLHKDLAPIIKRTIHTTADFEYARLFEASCDAVSRAEKALTKGCKIYADTSMIVAGVSKPSLKKLNCTIECLVHDAEVIMRAKQNGVTRSIEGINKACSDTQYKIFVIGNAPTALVRICELIQEKKISPDLVVGVPVGFVGAAESKEMIRDLGVPYMIVKGRKGGSPVGVSILNALMYQLVTRD